MSDIDESKQIPKIFDNRLNEPQHISILDELPTYRGIKILIDYDESRKILAKLVRNIKLIISHYPENRKKRCRDVNYWINVELSKHESIEKISDYILAIFNDIYWPKVSGEYVCDRNKNSYSPEKDKLKKELDDYCEIRDNNRCNVLKDKNECIKYNSYINRKKKYFSDEKNRICAHSGCSWNDYIIGENCTLERMDDTFRKINCEGLYKEAEIQEPAPTIKGRSPLEIGSFIIVSFILFYLFILFLEKFTPVGSIIHRFKRRKYDLKRNIEREDDERYSLYHSDKMPADSEYKSYYIEYSRPRN
ncbi:PIR protein [Plasmodium vivax]|uniref:VIR protein n=1 Tax=Plasmodium vivax TaxID=5855 RepID=A0A565A4D9_PLAVI|nr:PIR protein [Plasmodium vivax]